MNTHRRTIKENNSEIPKSCEFLSIIVTIGIYSVDQLGFQVI